MEERKMVTEILSDLLGIAVSAQNTSISTVAAKEPAPPDMETAVITAAMEDDVKPAAAGQNRRSVRRPRKLSYLSSEHQELRRLVRLGDPALLHDFVQKVDGPEILNIKDEEGNSVLNEISSKTAQFVKIAETLIQCKADVNSVDSLGNSPLHNALLYYPATHGMVQLLLDNGASMQSKNLSGSTPIQMPGDAGLESYLKNNNLEPTSPALEKWLAQTNNIPSKGASKKYKPLPESPYRSILKRKLKHLQKSESKPEVVDLNRKRKRGNSSGDEEDEVSCKRMRIRFAANDSLGSAIDPQFSDNE